MSTVAPVARFRFLLRVRDGASLRADTGPSKAKERSETRSAACFTPRPVANQTKSSFQMAQSATSVGSK